MAGWFEYVGRRQRRLATATMAVFVLTGAGAAAQQPDLADLSLEELLRVKITAAARRIS